LLEKKRKMEELYQYLHKNYSYKDGSLYWQGKELIGSYDSSNGYYKCYIKGKKHLLHRIIFLYFNEYLPEFIDHIDNNRINNRIENLRSCTRSQNCCNKAASNYNNIGYKNIWNFNGNYQIQVCKDRKKYTKYAKTLLEARIIANDLRKELHGEFAYIDDLS